MNNCLFCRIVAGEIPSKKIYEDDEMLIFYDIKPMAPVHFLVIPKKHIDNLMELEKTDAALAGRLFFKAQETAKELGCEDGGGRFVVNAKKDGRQTVNHLHIHFLGGCKLGGFGAGIGWQLKNT
ncbi:MAG: histidine triad nucleotide-binding protein [Treponema sp.]|nr:histidine triad nucleotide-binding protein [Treponema sp.]